MKKPRPAKTGKPGEAAGKASNSVGRTEWLTTAIVTAVVACLGVFLSALQIFVPREELVSLLYSPVLVLHESGNEVTAGDEYIYPSMSISNEGNADAKSIEVEFTTSFRAEVEVSPAARAVIESSPDGEWHSVLYPRLEEGGSFQIVLKFGREFDECFSNLSGSLSLYFVQLFRSNEVRGQKYEEEVDNVEDAGISAGSGGSAGPDGGC